jgi:hypothetical protein
MAQDVTLSLISHTNVGKTTLARTLLRRDVGEVLDQAHVTEEAESFTLIEAGGNRLIGWDTPGFGDSARMMKLLRRERNPLGWLLHQTWDRVANRPLYCSQRAIRNVRQEADVVLYLVNAAEEPHDAGYVSLELELLTWMERPVVLLLNQIGAGGAAPAEAWREYVKNWPVVRDVLSLDAFTRCWVEEDLLFTRLAALPEGDKQRAMETLAAAWSRRNLSVFEASVGQMTDYLATAASDQETPGPGGDDGDETDTLRLFREALKFTSIDKRRAMKQLNRRLDRSTARLMDELIAEHGLEGSSAPKIEQRVQDFQVKGGGMPLNERSGALAGAVVSGALSGLAADVLSGGLTLGGGMIAGGILGALGGAVIGRGYRMVGGGERPSVRWAPEFLDRLTEQVVLRYLAVAHFGRGRGQYKDREYPKHWSAAVEAALATHREALERAWTRAQDDDADTGDRLRADLRPIVEGTIRTVLREAYPHAASL